MADARRRSLLLGLPAVSFTLACSPVRDAVAQALQQAADASHAGFMRRAFDMRDRAIARGDQPYGAVVVRDGRIVGEGVSAVIADTDPTAHAEMQAIRDACQRLGTRDLSGCVLYGSSRACPMCEAAAYWAGISRMYAGEALNDHGAPRLSQR